jgi:hypothetical protein
MANFTQIVNKRIETEWETFIKDSLNLKDVLMTN